jgi:hypothetical protein
MHSKIRYPLHLSKLGFNPKIPLFHVFGKGVSSAFFKKRESEG